MAGQTDCKFEPHVSNIPGLTPHHSAAVKKARKASATIRANALSYNYLKTENSIRRFRNFPSSVSFVATGLVSPYPFATRAAGVTPCWMR